MAYICLDIKVGGNGGTAAEIDRIVHDGGAALLALDVDAVSVARDDLIVDDVDLVLGSRLQHDSAGFKVLEVAVLDVDVGVDSHDASRVRIVRRIALQLAVDHLDCGAFQHRDAWHLTVRFPENSTKEEG